MAEGNTSMRGIVDPSLLRATEARVTKLVSSLARPERLGIIQRVALVVLIIWSINSLAQLFWVVWPTPDRAPAAGQIVNPAVSGVARSASRMPISVDGALGLGLFGNPAETADAVSFPDNADAANSRVGIEDGARESRLALRLTGIVASSEDGLGNAVIEAKNEEQTYAVGDALPVAGDVTLAKVMATQVVISNGGTYELLKLFESNELNGVAVSASTTRKTAPAARSTQGQEMAEDDEVSANPATTRIATDVRRQLYDNPQSLAQLVSVSAVRDDNGLRGYRVAPGQRPEQFRALGFRAGDVITAVNGLSLSDPANTVRLYQMMRDATDATFEIERSGNATSLSVSLGALPQEP